MKAKDEWNFILVVFYLVLVYHCLAFNPLHPNISVNILHTVLCTSPKVLMKRIFLTIKCFFSQWPLPLPSLPNCVIKGMMLLGQIICQSPSLSGVKGFSGYLQWSRWRRISGSPFAFAFSFKQKSQRLKIFACRKVRLLTLEIHLNHNGEKKIFRVTTT